MRKTMPTWAMTALILGTMTVLVGCGLVPDGGSRTGSRVTNNATGDNQTGTTGVNNTQTGNGTQQNGGNSTPTPTQTQGNQAGGGQNGSTGAGAGFSTETVNSIQVGVPTAWTKTAIGGTGDWSGYRFVNPQDANQQVVVVSSSCAGCYMDPQGHVNPELVIPHANPTDLVKLNHGRSVQYNVADAKNPYTGTGLVTVSDDMSGYGYVEVFMPAADASQAKQILGSFTLGK